MYVLVVAALFVALAVAQNTIQLGGTVRDFTPATNPDFQYRIGTEKGLVKTDLGLPDRVPVLAKASPNTIHNSATFDQWYRDVPNVNLPFPLDLTLTKQADGITYVYDNSDFFPINDKGFGNYLNNRNFHFTFEAHSRFTYKGGEVFTFRGDDDVWVFINDKLVIDLGGVHGAQTQSVDLDAVASSIGIVREGTYNIDFFFAERHTTQSNFRITTSLVFDCPWFDRCGVCQGTGTTCPCNCTDSDPCTVDSCTVTGCAFTPLTCNDNKDCTVDTCDSQKTSGDPCVYTPKVCDDNNACTENNCVEGLGCQFPAISCSTSDLCKTATCNTATGCVLTDVTCDDNDLCTDNTCNSAVGCQFFPVDINDDNVCTEDSCTAQGGVVHTAIPCDACTGVTCTTTDACYPIACDVNTGNCTEYPVTCDDNNPCTEDSCYSLGADAYNCSNVLKTCTPPNACFTSACDFATGNCVNTAVDCDDGNACTDDSCSNGVCQHTATVCDSANFCQENTCDIITGCGVVAKPHSICDDNNACTYDTCNATAGACQNVEFEFAVDAANGFVNESAHGQIDACNSHYCDTVVGDVYRAKECGTDCDCALEKGGCGCPVNSSIISPAAAAGIGAGILAVIIIAVIAAVAIFGFGGKKAYDYAKLRQNRMGIVEDNPLYKEENGNHENPLYVEEMNEA